MTVLDDKLTHAERLNDLREAELKVKRIGGAYGTAKRWGHESAVDLKGQLNAARAEVTAIKAELGL